MFSGQCRNIKLIKRHFSKPRGVIRNPIDKDPYVKEALKLFDRKIYSESCGFTRAGGDLEKLEEAATAFDRVYPKFMDMSPKARYVLLQSYDRVREEFRLEQKAIPKWIYSVDVDVSKSTGYPWFKKKGDMIDELFEEARHTFHRLKYYGIKAKVSPVTFATRGKLSTQEERKTRLVWQYSGDVTICEGVFAQPLIEAYYHDPKYAQYLLTGAQAIHKHQRLANETNRYGNTFYGFDFKQYDASIPPFLIRMGFSILRENLEFGAYEDETEVKYGGVGVKRRAETAFDALVHYFIHTPFLVPEGHLFRKHGGIPSGSHFTNLVESIITRIIILWLLEMSKLTFHLTMLLTNGDDSAFILNCNAKLDLVHASDMIKDSFGMILHPDKTVVVQRSEGVHASGTFWALGYPSRSDQELFRLALASKSFVRDAQTSFSRLTGLWISGGFTSTRFCAFYNYFQTCYPLLPPGREVFDWKLRAMGADPDMFKHGINIHSLCAMYY